MNVYCGNTNCRNRNDDGMCVKEELYIDKYGVCRQNDPIYRCKDCKKFRNEKCGFLRWASEGDDICGEFKEVEGDAEIH